MAKDARKSKLEERRELLVDRAKKRKMTDAKKQADNLLGELFNSGE
jgi:hypothetical protein